MDTDEVSLRILVAGDEPVLRGFLRARAESSLFLISNLTRGGFVDTGERFTGTFVGRFESDALTGVVAHCWNGNVLVQAPGATPDLVLHAARAAGRRVKGLVGPWEQVASLRAAPPFAAWPVELESAEILYALPLDRLRVPPLLASGKAFVRRGTPEDLELLSTWALDYAEEALNAPRNAETAARVAASSAREIAEGVCFVLELDGAPVAHSAFNASTDDTVQIGGVWTPRALRRRGHARAVVAGQLLIARAEGKTRSVLFTQDRNTPAQRAYEAIGYTPIGDYGLVHFAGEGVEVS